ncbi:periodic tryptophan protein 2 [Pancytospora philotis]|nr:periodic tryptophan protein 2 [Pancytospora philotis]
MSGYAYKTTVPTESEADMLVLGDALYFAAHTNIYKVEGESFSAFASVEGTARHAAVNGNNLFVCTDDRVVMNYGPHSVGSLRRAATAIDANERIFAIGVGPVLEVWAVPREYKFTLFRKLATLPGHHSAISIIRIVDDEWILTAARDRSVRLFNVVTKESKLVATTRDDPAGLFLLGDGMAAVTSRDGTMTHFPLHGSGSKRAEFEWPVLCGAADGGLFAVVLECPVEEPKPAAENDHFHFSEEKKTITTGAEPADGVDENIIKPGFRAAPKRYTLVVRRGDEELYRADIDRRVEHLSMHKQRIAMRSRSFVGIFDMHLEKFVFCVDLPRIVAFSVDRGLVAAGCADGRTRLYRDHVCKGLLLDTKAVGDILGVFQCGNTCITTLKTGYISAFNVADQHCYRSFSISTRGSLAEYSQSAATEDGAVVFMAAGNSIAIVDMQRSKQIDEIKLAAPVARLAFHDGFIYYLCYDNKLTKHDFVSGKATELALEETAVGFAVKGRMLAVSTFSGVTLYDLDFCFVSSFAASLEARHREELFSKPKPVEQIDFDGHAIVCAGNSNQIKVLGREAAAGASLVPYNLVQTLRISRNRDWENYKERLDKERKTSFSKENFIEARQLVVSGGRIYALSREGIVIFDTTARAFNPIEFNVTASPEFVAESLAAGNPTAALVAALQLGDYPLIQRVVEATQDVPAAVKYVPRALVETMVDCVMELLRSDYSNTRLLEFVKWATYYHGVVAPHSYEAIKEGNAEEYEALRASYFMLKNIMKKS